MSNDTESITGEVVDSVTVENLSQGVQITSIDLEGESETNQYGKRGEYKLVRVDE